MAKFKPGQSGNPAGRPPGAKSTASALRKELITDEDLQEIVDTVIAKAKEGDLTAAGMILDRRIPRLRVSVMSLDDPTLGSLADQLKAARERIQLRVITGVPDPVAEDEPEAPRKPKPAPEKPPEPKPAQPVPAPAPRWADAQDTGSEFDPYAD